jgi:DNA-binding SARP family transcriptional activator
MDIPADAERLRFDVLGPLRVRAGRETVAINAQKPQILLALLLINGDQVVSIEQLTAQIWGDHVPSRARAGVHVYVSQLRKLFASATRSVGRYDHVGNGNKGNKGGRADTDTDGPLLTSSPGYRLAVEPGDLDLHIFQCLTDQGQAHAQAGRHREAVECFDAALRLWRGPALNGLRDCAAINSFAAWLEEIRLRCTELSIESSLHLGRHHDVIGTLYTLTTDHPLRETFYLQLMLALYRAERRAEALAAYRGARERLRQELGLDPCRALQDLHRSILLGDDALAVKAT